MDIISFARLVSDALRVLVLTSGGSHFSVRCVNGMVTVCRQVGTDGYQEEAYRVCPLVMRQAGVTTYLLFGGHVSKKDPTCAMHRMSMANLVVTVNLLVVGC